MIGTVCARTWVHIMCVLGLLIEIIPQLDEVALHGDVDWYNDDGHTNSPNPRLMRATVSEDSLRAVDWS